MTGFVRVADVLPMVGEMKRTSIEPCACGGRVRADRRFPMAGVQAHNRTKLHQAWRAAREAQ